MRRIYTPEIKKRKKEIKKSKQERKQEVGIEPALTGSQDTHADHNKGQLTLLFVPRALRLRGIYTPGATGNAEKDKIILVLPGGLEPRCVVMTVIRTSSPY